MLLLRLRGLGLPLRPTPSTGAHAPSDAAARHSPTLGGFVGLEKSLLPTGIEDLQPDKPDKPAFAERPIRGESK